MLNYRNAPHPLTGKSPAELMIRQIMTRIPKIMKPMQEKIDEAKAQDGKSREERKTRYDKRNQVKECKITEGDKVIIRQDKTMVKEGREGEKEDKGQSKGAKILFVADTSATFKIDLL
jgi:hypothetical protein